MLLPERNFAISILTNAQNGWRLIQEVEREALRAYHGIVYGRNQAIAHRGDTQQVVAGERAEMKV